MLLERKNWIRLCLLREACVKLSRVVFVEVWNALIFLNPSGEPWEGTRKDGEHLWSILNGQNILVEPHEEAFIRSGETEAWELQIISNLIVHLPVPDHLNAPLRFKDLFAGVLKKQSCSNDEFQDVFHAAKLVYEQKQELDSNSILNCDFELAEKHLKVMEYIRKGHMIRIFKKDKNQATEVYGKAVPFASNENDETLIVASFLKAALEYADQDPQGARERGQVFLEFAERRVKRRPDSWECHADLGKIQKLLSNKDGALKSFNEALKLNPTRGDLTNLVHELESGPDQRPSTDLSDFLDKTKNQVGLNLSWQSMKPIIEHAKESGITSFASNSSWMEGLAFEEGFEGRGKDTKKAFECFQKASDLGDPMGKVHLARFYKDGVHVKKDLKKSADLLQEAMRAPLLTKDNAVFYGRFPGDVTPGAASAMAVLGEYYHQGIWYPICNKIALDLFLKAIDAGCMDAGFHVGNFYAMGIIVDVNLEKARQFWKMAADVGSGPAMYNLAIGLLQHGDLGMAKEWYARANERGSVDAAQAKYFNETLRNTKEKLGMLEKLERKQKIAPDHHMSIRDRLEHLAINAMGEENAAKIGKTFSEFSKDMERMLVSPRFENSRSFKVDPELLFQRAKEGHRFAQQMATALASLFTACEILTSDLALGLACNDHGFVHEYANFYRTECEFVGGLPLVLLEPATQSIKRVLSSACPANVEIDARICWGALNFGKMDVSYVKACIEKFPAERHFWRSYLAQIGFKNEFAEGMKQVFLALKQFPDDVELLYFNAVCSRMNLGKGVTRIDAIKSFEKFIENAPSDHRKVPEAYYCIALHHFPMEQPEKMKQLGAVPDPVKENMEKGLQAEKQILPCFLPYDSNSKRMVERIFTVVEALPPQGRNTKSTNKSGKRSKPVRDVTSNPSPVTGGSGTTPKEGSLSRNSKKGHSELVLTNPVRLRQIVHHRNFIAELTGGKFSGTQIRTTMQPPKEQRASLSSSFARPIKLAEIDATKDKVYEKRQIKLTCVEDGCRMVGIMFLVEDESGDTERMAVYNTPDDDPRLAYGSTFTVNNPYMRIAQDGKPMIRVDDPHSIIYHSDESDPDRCRFCGKGGASFKCGKCLRAKYCTNDCQTRDWKLMKHSLICKAVKP